jgi:hypothetical protein
MNGCLTEPDGKGAPFIRLGEKKTPRALNWRLPIAMVRHFAGTNLQIMSMNFERENWQRCQQLFPLPPAPTVRVVSLKRFSQIFGASFRARLANCSIACGFSLIALPRTASDTCREGFLVSPVTLLEASHLMTSSAGGHSGTAARALP